jgi:hypothetical protein
MTMSLGRRLDTIAMGELRENAAKVDISGAGSGVSWRN